MLARQIAINGSGCGKFECCIRTTRWYTSGMELENTLREVLRSSGLSMREIARQSGIDVSVISRFLAGKSLDSSNFSKLCDLFELTLAKKPKGKQ